MTTEQRGPQKERRCEECGQPMLPKGVKKLPNEYDHAQGCPLDPQRDPQHKPLPLGWLDKQREARAAKRQGGK